MIATISSNEAKVWEFNASSKSIEEKLIPQPLHYDLSYCCWNHTNQVVALANSQGQINLCHAQTGQLLSVIPFEKDSLGQIVESLPTTSIREVAFSANSRYIAHTLNDSIIVWDLKKRSIRNNLLCPGAATQGGTSNLTARSLSFFPEGTLVSGDSSGHIQIWDVSKSSSTAATALVSNTKFDAISAVPRAAPPSVSCVRVSTSGTSKVVATYSSGYLCMFDAATTSLLRQQQVHASDIPCVAFSPKNPRLVVSAGSDGKLILHDTGSRGDLVTAAITLGAPATTLSFHEDAIHTAVGTQQGRVLIYDWRNVSKAVATWEPHSGQPIVSVAFQTPSSAGTSLTVSSSASSTASGLCGRGPAGGSIPSSITSTPRRSLDEALKTPIPATLSKIESASIVSKSGHVSSSAKPADVKEQSITNQSRSPTQSTSAIEHVPRIEKAANSPDRVTISASISPARSAPSSSSPPPTQPLSSTSDGATVHATASLTPTKTPLAQLDAPQNRIPTSTTATVAATKAASERDSLLSALSEATAGIAANSNLASGAKYARPVPPLPTPSKASYQMTETQSGVHPASSSSSAASLSTPMPVNSTQPNDASPTPQKLPPSASRRVTGASTGGDIDNRISKDTSILNSSAISVSGSKFSTSISPSTPLPIAGRPPATSSSKKQKDSSNPVISPSASTNLYPLLEQAVQPVSQRQLQEELQLLRYDLHKELQNVVREQRREIEYAKEDTAQLIGEMAAMLRDLLQANEVLRRENEKLRGHMLIKYD